MRLPATLGFIGILGLLSAPLLAEPLYQIEVMLIAYTNEQQIQQEDWPASLIEAVVETEEEQDPEQLLIDSIDEELASLESQPEQPIEQEETQPEPKPELTLTDAVKHIRPRKDMQLLWHETWIEPIQDKSMAVVHPLDLQAESSDYAIQLVGDISFSMSRYLHIHTNLIMQHNVAEQPLRAASIQQTRRMRSNELHYLDHPMLGIMVKIMPVK